MRFRSIKKRWGLGRGKDKRKADLGDGRGGGLTQRTSTVLARVGAQQTERTQTLFPERISRYRVRRLLGVGAFGRVFLALDEELQRPVAVKVPRALCPPNLKTEAFLQEARRVLLEGVSSRQVKADDEKREQKSIRIKNPVPSDCRWEEKG